MISRDVLRKALKIWRQNGPTKKRQNVWAPLPMPSSMEVESMRILVEAGRLIKQYILDWRVA